MDPFFAGAASWLLQQAAGKVFDLAVNRLLGSMGFHAASPSSTNTQSLLDEYRKQLITRLDEDRIAKLHGALSQLKDAQQTVAKYGYLTQALSTFHVIAHLPEQGVTGGKRNAELRCVALLGMAAAHVELGDQPQLTAEKIIAAVQADPPTAQQWLGQQVVQMILAHYPLRQQPSSTKASTAAAATNIPAQHVIPSGIVVVAQQGGGNYLSITEAVQNASPSTRILVRPGIYAEEVVLTKRLELVGEGPKADIIWSNDPPFTVQGAHVIIQGLTLRSDEMDAAEVVQRQLSLIDCDLSGKLNGLSIEGRSAKAIIQRCIIHHAQYCGVDLLDSGQVTIEESEIFANGAEGIAMHEGCQAQIFRCKIYDNGRMGVWAGPNAQGTIEECQFKRNKQGAWHIDPRSQIRLHKNTR